MKRITKPKLYLMVSLLVLLTLVFSISLALIYSLKEIVISVNVVSPPLEIAVNSVVPFKTVVCQGYKMRINVTITNEGPSTKNFNVTAHADLNPTTIGDEITIGTKNGTLPSGNSTTLTFIWNTTGVDKGIYTISATADNIFIDSTVTVSCKGDITGPTPNVPDGTVNMRDISLVAKGFGANLVTDPYSPKYGEYWHTTPCDQCPHSANCDLTGSTLGLPDGTINMRDISLVARLFGTGGC